MRFLDGEPVRARRIGPGYRLLRKMRKHPAVVATIGAGLVLASPAGRYVVAPRGGMAAERAVLAQRFGQEAEQIESVLWKSRTIPLHDTRPQKQLIRQRMDRLLGQVEELGPVARGPGTTPLVVVTSR